LKSYCVSECNDQCKEIIEKYQEMECFEELKDSIGDLLINSQKSCCESNQIFCESTSNLPMGVIIGIVLGTLIIGIIIGIVAFIHWRKSKNHQSKHIISDSYQEIESSQRTSSIPMVQIKSQENGVEATLMNTILEVAIPGFMNLDFVNQIRKEEKIGGGGAAILYKGVILDPKLSEVVFFFFEKIFFFFQK